ncbi:MAG: WbqC family protein [Bacteroidaceae bacterium]|nr:WbqC family protein [Bacteroidaceae bacterium]
MPYIGYYQPINLVDKFVIYDDANYINKDYNFLKLSKSF